MSRQLLSYSKHRRFSGAVFFNFSSESGANFSLPTAVPPHFCQGDFPYSVRIDDPPHAPPFVYGQTLVSKKERILCLS